MDTVRRGGSVLAVKMLWECEVTDETCTPYLDVERVDSDESVKNPSTGFN